MDILAGVRVGLAFMTGCWVCVLGPCAIAFGSGKGVCKHTFGTTSADKGTRNRRVGKMVGHGHTAPRKYITGQGTLFNVVSIRGTSANPCNRRHNPQDPGARNTSQGLVVGQSTSRKTLKTIPSFSLVYCFSWAGNHPYVYAVYTNFLAFALVFDVTCWCIRETAPPLTPRPIYHTTTNSKAVGLESNIVWLRHNIWSFCKRGTEHVTYASHNYNTKHRVKCYFPQASKGLHIIPRGGIPWRGIIVPPLLGSAEIPPSQPRGGAPTLQQSFSPYMYSSRVRRRTQQHHCFISFDTPSAGGIHRVALNTRARVLLGCYIIIIPSRDTK